MTALQQSIHVMLSLRFLQAVLGYDLVDEVVVPFQRGKVLFGELISLRADFLENDLLGLCGCLRLCSGGIECRAARSCSADGTQRARANVSEKRVGKLALRR
jgi:hypothetical protein